MKIEFLKALVERALKTFAQTLLASLGVGAATDIVSMPWLAALSLAAGAAVLSVISSIASAGFGNDGPSLAGEELK